MILRMIAIAVGSFIGGFLAKAPKNHTMYMWLSLITQAGVSLGLAGEINFQFHDSWGPACATSIVAVIMLNQIAGPILCKFAIKKVGEAGKAKGNEDEEGKGILILGINGYSLALAERLKNSHWKVTMADVNATKLPFAMRLNTTPGADPHEQVSDAKAIQKKKKVYQNLEEDMEPVTLDSPIPPLTPTDAPAAPSYSQSVPPSHSIITPPPPPPPSTTPSPSDPAAHVEEHEKIHDIQVCLMEDLDKSSVASSEAMVSKWNYRELANGLEPKTDVVLCMLEPDSVNVGACSSGFGLTWDRFYKNHLKFVRVFAAVNSPTTIDMYLRTNAVPFYSLSATVNTLFNFVTANRVNAKMASQMIYPEAEGFPRNIELLPFLQPAPDNYEALEALELNNNLIDIDIESPPPASGTHSADSSTSSISSHPPPTANNPMARFGGMMREGFNTTTSRLSALRDPVGLVQRGVAQMHVEEDEHRDAYLDEIEALGDTMSRPVTTNSIWMDLLGPSQSNANANAPRRVDNVYQDPSTVQGNFRSDMSVFEQYQGMNNNNNNNR